MEHRKIIHIDMDAFFASVEQRDNPHYRNKPIAVGGGELRGVVAAASYEARKYGVHSAMPGAIAAKKCPDLIFVKPRFDVYKAVSRKIRDIFEEYTPLVEPLSLDEAFLDVSDPLKGPASATLIALEIRKRIYDQLQLTCSAGISYNKFLAKVASDINKPNGYFVISPKEAVGFLERLPIEKFYGVGKVTADKFRKMGITSGKQLKEAGRLTIQAHFGKPGGHLFDIAHGRDSRPVEPNRISKSVGAENTFSKDLVCPGELEKELKLICKDVYLRLRHKKRFGRTLTLKIKYSDFVQHTRSRSFMTEINSQELIFETAHNLLRENLQAQKPVRLLGVSMSQLEGIDLKAGLQLRLNFEF